MSNVKHLTVVLSGDDILRFKGILKANTVEIAPTDGSVLRNLIRKEYDRLVDNAKIDDAAILYEGN